MRVVQSIAMFYAGEPLRLRPDMGGGRYVVVRWWRMPDGFHAALIMPVLE